MEWIAAVFVVYVCLLQCHMYHAEPEPDPQPISIVPRVPNYSSPYQQNQCCGQKYYYPSNYMCGTTPCSIIIIINKKPEDDDTTNTEDTPKVPIDVKSGNSGATSVAAVAVDADGDGKAKAAAAAAATAATNNNPTPPVKPKSEKPNNNLPVDEYTPGKETENGEDGVVLPDDQDIVGAQTEDEDNAAEAN